MTDKNNEVAKPEWALPEGIVTCDIETMPEEDCLRLFEYPEFSGKDPGEFNYSPPSNWKDPVKIQEAIDKAREKHEAAVLEYHAKAAAWEDEQEAKFLEKAALYASTGRVLAIGYLEEGEKGMNVFLDIARTGLYEERVITRFFQTLMRPKVFGVSVRGFNFWEFDLPFLYTRARLLQLPILDQLPNKFWDLKEKVQDVYVEATCGQRHYNQTCFPAGMANLKAVAKAFRCSSSYRENECDGAEFAKHLLDGDPKLQKMAINHLTADLWETYDISQSCRLP